MEIKSAQLDTGVNIEYSLTGPSTAETLLFVHGLGPNLRQFAPQEKFFSQHYRVLLLSLRGHGGSTIPQHPQTADFTVAKLADDVKALLAFLNIQRVHFVGNSLGGLLGYQQLECDKNLITSLTTFGTTAELHSSAALVWFLTSLTRLLGPKTLGKMAGLSTRDKSVASQVADMFASAQKDAVWRIQKNISDCDYTPLLRSFKLPVQVIRGQLDKEINQQLDSTLQALQSNPHFRLDELEDVGHFSSMEAPAVFNRTLLDFINGMHAAQS